jgi:hypothetical protein
MSSAMLASSIDHVGEIRNHAGRECKWHADMASAHVGKSGGFLGRAGAGTQPWPGGSLDYGGRDMSP